MPFLRSKQQAAARFASSFGPETSVGIWFRNQVTRLMGLPFIADLAIGRTLRDDIALPRTLFEAPQEAHHLNHAVCK